MALITDLPLELLTIIVSLYRNPTSESASSSPRDIRNLSLLTKAFNEACAPFLFRHHTVSIRSRRTQRYSVSYAKMRIAVIARRSMHIRELKIRDFKTIGVEPFPDDIIPHLLEALKPVNGLNRLMLENLTPVEEGEDRRVPDLLWTWIKEQGSQLRYLNIEGPWLPPVQADIVNGIHRLMIDPLTEGNSGFIKVVKSRCLSVRNSDLFPFRPGKDLGYLMDIYVEVFRDWDDFITKGDLDQPALLDFSELPSTTVTVDLKSTMSGRYVSKFREYEKVRYALKMIFAEDLTTYNVMRVKLDPHLIIRREPDLAIKHQDQVVDEEADNEELLMEQREAQRQAQREARIASAREPRRIRIPDWR